MPNAQKSRAPKTSKGENRGSKPVRLTSVEKVLMGKGQAKTIKHVQCSNWKGVQDVHVPFDPEQAKINIAMGYC